MTPEEVQALIDQSIAVAINQHNRNATMVSMSLGFIFMGAFVDGLFRVLGIVPPFMGLDANIIPEIAKYWNA